MSEKINPHDEKWWADSELDSESLADALGAHSWFHLDEPNPTAELMREAATRIRALQKRLDGPKTPPGWKLVPMEPTLPMKEAAALYRANCMDKGLRKTFGGYYRTMVGAAPEYQPPATKTLQEKS